MMMMMMTMIARHFLFVSLAEAAEAAVVLVSFCKYLFQRDTIATTHTRSICFLFVCVEICEKIVEGTRPTHYRIIWETEIR